MLKIAVINPYARRTGYSGPNILMDRLFSTLSDVCEVTLVCGDHFVAEAYKWPTRVDVPVGFDKTKRSSQFLWIWRTTFWTVRNSSKFDVVHVHGAYLFNLLTVLPCALMGRPYVVLPLGSGDISSTSRKSRLPVVRLLRRFVLSRASVGLALSDEIAEQFLFWNLGAEKVNKLGNIASGRCFEFVPSWTTQQVAFVGSLSVWKRPGLLLDALSVLRERGFDVSAVFVGPYSGDEMRVEVERKIVELDLEGKVRVLGFQDDVIAALTGVSVFVLPSAQEGLPGALVEAMAMGLPTIVTSAGSMERVVKAAQSGMVVGGSGVEIADAIGELLASESLWKDLSRNGRAYAEANFSSSAVGEQYLNTLKEISE